MTSEVIDATYTALEQDMIAAPEILDAFRDSDLSGTIAVDFATKAKELQSAGFSAADIYYALFQVGLQLGYLVAAQETDQPIAPSRGTGRAN